MKKLLSTLVLLAVVGSAAFAQMKIDSSCTQIIDRYDKRFKHWGGDMEAVHFWIVKQKINKTETTFLQISVESKEWQVASRSSGVAVGKGGAWAVGLSTDEIANQQKGIIELSKTDYDAWKSQVNLFFLKSQGAEPDFDTTWDFALNGRLVYSLIYTKGAKWSYGLALDGAEFEIPTTDALEMLKKVVAFGKYFP